MSGLTHDEAGTSWAISWLYPTEDLIFSKQQKSLRQFQHRRQVVLTAELNLKQTNQETNTDFWLMSNYSYVVIKRTWTFKIKIPEKMYE